MDKKTPLVKFARHTPYVDSGLYGGGIADDERAVDGEDIDSEDEISVDRAATLKREEDATFGAWLWRLLNRHICPSLILNCFKNSYLIPVVVMARSVCAMYLLSKGFGFRRLMTTSI
jgi:hypothetical protein